MASQAPKAPEKKEQQPKRRGTQNPLIYGGTIVVLVIVVIAFVFVPMGGGSGSSVSDNGRSLNFGSYDGKAIEYSQGSYMALQVRDLNDRLRQQGLTEDNYQLFAFQVYRGAFERTVIRLSAIDAVKKSGGYVTEAWLDKKVAESPSYQENGKFSAQKYHDATLSEKLSVRNQIRDDTLYQTYFEDLLSVGPSSAETAFVKDMAKQTRSVEYAAVPLSKYPDAEVEAWGKAHADLFRSLTLSRVTILSSEADAKKLLKNIQDKKTCFADVAKASSKDAYASKGGLEGPKFFFELQSEFAAKADADKIVALKAGELSPVLKTVSGSWAFFKAEAEPTKADFSQATLLSTVRNYMSGNERGILEDWAIAQAKAIDASAADFAQAAKKAGFELKSAGPFPINYGDLTLAVYGQSVPIFKQVQSEATPELAGASTSEKFFVAAFSTAPGSVAQPIVLGENVLAIKVKDAGSEKDDESAALAFYYPYLYQSTASGEVSGSAMKSKLLKDEFSKVFFKYFQPASSQSSAKKS